MSVLSPFRANDLFRFKNIQVQYGVTFYTTYLQRWSDLCFTQESPRGRLQSYILGKAEGVQTEWHDHITAVSVAPEYCHEIYKGYFVGLYVRCNNTLAIKMYEVKEHYGNVGVGKYDMRKCLSRDAAQQSIGSNG
ncbi:hypothetical protein BDR07DRAFT_1427068 [Suillus spraguei]|nr:hypothetical protein BDR07DRAFT_1427068 [Suillus spraguei]